MGLIIGQLAIKAGWRDVHVAPWDLPETICQNIIYKNKLFFNDLSSKFNRSFKRARYPKRFKCEAITEANQ